MIGKATIEVKSKDEGVTLTNVFQVTTMMALLSVIAGMLVMGVIA